MMILHIYLEVDKSVTDALVQSERPVRIYQWLEESHVWVLHSCSTHALLHKLHMFRLGISSKVQMHYCFDQTRGQCLENACIGAVCICETKLFMANTQALKSFLKLRLPEKYIIKDLVS